MATNIMISGKNWIDDATIGKVLDSNGAPSHANLQDYQLSSKISFNPASVMEDVFVLDSVRPVNLVALLGTNFSQTAQWDVWLVSPQKSTYSDFTTGGNYSTNGSVSVSGGKATWTGDGDIQQASTTGGKTSTDGVFIEVKVDVAPDDTVTFNVGGNPVGTLSAGKSGTFYGGSTGSNFVGVNMDDWQIDAAGGEASLSIDYIKIRDVKQWDDAEYDMPGLPSTLADAVPRATIFGSTPWSSFYFDGKVPDSNWNSDGYKKQSIAIFDDWYNTEIVFIGVSDTSNTNTNVEIGRAVIASSFSPKYNFRDDGLELKWIDESDIQKSEGGQTYYDSQEQRREMRIRFSEITRPEYAGLSTIFEQIGQTKDVLIVPRPDDTTYHRVEALYGRIKRDPTLKKRAGCGDNERWECTLEIEELL